MERWIVQEGEGVGRSFSGAHVVTPHETRLAAYMSRSPRTRTEVLRFVTEQGDHGATAEEIEASLEMGGNTVRPRLVELRKMGLVVASGRVRLTAYGRSAVVWIRGK
jgi:predicted ArsR family transcriptional regulator